MCVSLFHYLQPSPFNSMASLTLQNMKNEKANAMRRFQIKRFLEAMFHFFNLSATLFLFYRSSWFPTTVNTFCQLYHHSMLLLQNNLFAFILLNTIILFLLALSNQNAAVPAVSHDPAAAAYSQIEYLRLPLPEANNDGRNIITEFTLVEHQPETPPCSSSETTVEPPLLSPIIDGTVSTPEKQQPATPPCFSGTTVETLSPILEETVTAVTETTTTTMTTCRSRAIVSAENGIGDQKEVSEKKCYRRVQSERRVVVAPPRRELDRSNTGLEVKKKKKKKSNTTEMQYVENLSKEEFNRAVEEFIAKQKKMLWEEQNR